MKTHHRVLSGLVAVAMLLTLAACEKTPESAVKDPAATSDQERAPRVKPRILSAKGFNPTAGEASPEGRLAIGRGKDYTPIAADPAVLFKQLEGSMEQRRRTAWAIVEAMLEPQNLELNGQTFDVPLWHTWYEGSSANAEVRQKIRLFIAELKACKADSNCHKTREEIAREVVAGPAQKNLVRSLTEENLTEVLRQSQIGAPNPAQALGRGFTLFSPAFVEHVLSQAEGIEKCAPDVAWDAPPPSPIQFSPCITEFPRAAVMVKTSWSEVNPADPKANYRDSDAATMTTLIHDGTWSGLKEAPIDESTAYVVETAATPTRPSRRFALNGIHFSTKDTREWVWVTLWWSPDPTTDFGEDRPNSIARFNSGVWANYKMCVTSSFEEGDTAPGSTFQATRPGLAASLQATHAELEKQKAKAPYDKVTTWCSNPNLETHDGNGRTNCIGCHQYSFTRNEDTGDFTSFDETLSGDFAPLFPQFGRSRRRANFPSDFAWSFTFEFPPAIIQARREQNFEW